LPRCAIIPYIGKRILLLVPLLAAVTFSAFLLLKALPGDPVLALVGERADPSVMEEMRRELGLDKGVMRQYGGYLLLLLKGDMGRSYYTQRDVFADIMGKFPRTIRLALASMLMAVPLGVILGIVSVYGGVRWGRFVDALSMAGLSIPVFWLGIVVMLVFSLRLKWLPPSGTGGIRFLILPAAVLAVPAMATLIRVTRASVLEVREMAYVRTATAKGLRPLRIRFIHVLRNAIIPVVTIIGLDFGSYLNGAVVTETIFGWDGIGRFTMEGIIKRDYPVIMGCIIVGTIVFVLVNTITDIVYHALDPRVRLHGKEN
jgi:ABC-type dipeptide/oligopeptide/nickel transport system permease component